MNKVQILVIEDDIAVGNLITTTLEMENYQFRLAKPDLFLEKYQSYEEKDSRYQKIRTLCF